MDSLFIAPAEKIVLKDFQSEGLEKLRQNIRATGEWRQILYAPTGAGKTILAVALTLAAVEVGSKVVFITDRSALVEQTSEVYDRFGVDHGIIQADHWRCRPFAKVQIISAQTLASRIGKGGYLDQHLQGARLVIVDEAHSLYRATVEWIAKRPEKVAVVGLSASPFARGLGRHYPGIVNVATTDHLVAIGALVKPIFYAAIEANTAGVAVKSTGEWDDEGLEREGIKIIGDVATEYVRRTMEDFGRPVKAIYFSATVKHGEEMCRALNGLGYNFQQISYLDDEEERKAKIKEFRKANSAITGLISVDALAKGFDVSDIRICGICRPLRKSFSTHVQQVGRVMRPAPGKDKAVVIDHAGNSLRFLQDMVDLWANGVDKLDEGAEKDRAARSVSEKDRKEQVCICGAVLLPSDRICPACGKERPARPSDVKVVSGTAQRLDLTAQSSRGFRFESHPLLKDPTMAYQSILAFTTRLKRGDAEAARRWTNGIYHGVYEQWPPRSFGSLPHIPELLTLDVERFCRREMARFAKSRPRHAA